MVVNYDAGRGESPHEYSSLDDKLEKAVDVIETAVDEYENPAILWTGGKDSTLLLYLVLEVYDKKSLDYPPAVFIDHFQHFDETIKFVERWGEKLGLDVLFEGNENVQANAEHPGDEIPVESLNEKNQREVREVLEFEEEEFPFLLNTLVGNHLLKTVPLQETIEENEFDAVFSGIRWDEQESRSDETFFSERETHDRVHPILQFEEIDVWDATWDVMVPSIVDEIEPGTRPNGVSELPVDLDEIPISGKYFGGYRSLGSETGTDKTTDEVAWNQDLENTTEREGRAQDKEGVMERLRDLGYM